MSESISSSFRIVFHLTVYDGRSWTLGLRLLAGIVGLEDINIEGIEIMGVAEIAQRDCGE